MNKKIVLNWIRSLLNLKQICEVNRCTAKAEYSIIRWHGNSMLVCRNHFPHMGDLDSMFGEELE